jgi:hypothetical protein
MLFGLVTTVAALSVSGQELQIGIIDFYGLSRLSERDLRQTLTFREGDRVTIGRRPAFLAASEDRLKMVPGVMGVRTTFSCCDAGRLIVYIGIHEEGAPTMDFRPPPSGAARLAADIVQAGAEFEKALAAAVQRGDAAEDDSQGHALARDPATRGIQERFIAYARRDLSTLREVLRDSSDSSQRALAALVLGYVVDKQAVVADLVQAMSDPFEDVRNNAMRALWVFTNQTPTAARPVPQVPSDPFIALLNSPGFSDRNKASVALMALSQNRDAVLLAKLRQEAMLSLIEMARWKSAGHALPAFTILGRMAGFSDEAARAAWERGERVLVIDGALNPR